MASSHLIYLYFLPLVTTLCFSNTIVNTEKGHDLSLPNARVITTSTCGEFRPQRYCSTTDERNIFCEICTGEDRIENVLSENSSLYWISDTQSDQEVYITMKYNKLFRINKVILKAVFTTLPSQWLLEVSKDHGKTYTIVKYLVSNIENCSLLHDIEGGDKLCIVQQPTSDGYGDRIEVLLDSVLVNEIRLKFIALENVKYFKNLDEYTRFFALERFSVIGRRYKKKVQSHKRIRRQACFCSHIGTSGGICNYPGRFCPCKRGFSGRRCDKCAKGLYDFPNCKPCGCSTLGSISPFCKRSTGLCRCKTFVEGRTCDKCVKGYSGFPKCSWCSCHVKNTIGQGCDKQKKCLCKNNYAGVSCGECKPGYTGYPVCKKLDCFCASPGSLDTVCDTQRQCRCKPGYRGAKCDQCSKGYFGFPNCQVCACHGRGAFYDQCDSVSGKCVCHRNIAGRQCDRCIEGYSGFPRCHSCTCNIYGSLRDLNSPQENRCTTGNEEFKCNCKTNVAGATCDRCKDMYYLFSPTNPQGCKKCGCLRAGTLGGLESCDQKKGQCSCKPFVEAGKCYECRRGYHTLKEGDLFGCEACRCNPGGARYANCDKKDGKCKCRKYIGGFHCDRIRRSPVYTPSLHHITAEAEEGKTINGKAIRYDFNNSIFPAFSWKGYVPFSDVQTNVVITIDIPRRSVYRILYRCVFEPVGYPTTASLSFTITPDEGVSGLSRTIPAVVKTTRNGKGERSALLALSQGIDPDEFLMFKGKWKVEIFCEHKYFLLDYLVFLPRQYYAATILQTERVEPCLVDGPKNVICDLYSYPDEIHKSVVKFEAENGTFAPTPWSKENTKTVKYYRDNNVLEQLGFNGMAHLNKEQNRFTIEMMIPKSGFYAFIVQYYSPGLAQEKIDMYVERERGSVHILPCIYKFGCRQVVMKDVNVVKMFDLLKGIVTINLFTSKDADIAVDHIKAIPERLWQLTYITPAFVCRYMNAKCLSSSYDDAGVPRLSPSSSHTRRGVKVVRFRRFFNKQQQKLRLILQYQQTQHVSVQASLQIQTYNRKSEGTVMLKYCPNKDYCRVVVKVKSVNGDDDNDVFTVRQGTTTIQIQFQKNVKISWLYLVKESLNADSYLEFLPIDNSNEFVEKCSRNNFVIPKTDKGYCMRSSFALTTHFNDGAMSCRCSYYGSKSRYCEGTYGQCSCRRPNIIGRQCSECASGYYGFPYCRRCSCDQRGSISGTCDYLGRCKCKPNFSGQNCHRCKAGYFGFPNCRACNCSVYGSLSTFCTSVTGQCQCRRSFDGPQCNKCRIGFFGFPDCQECNCDASGIKPVEGLPSGCNSTNAKCTCKDNVIGPQCDTCKDYHYNLQFNNPKGCQKCSCSTWGTNSELKNCHKVTGQCPCKSHATGQNCAVCKSGFTKLKKNSMFGCRGCECDYAGSWDNVCNKVTSTCSCKRNIGGTKCTKVKSRDYYIKDLHHLSTEFEDAKHRNGRPVNIRYDDKEFPGFSGRGYVPVTTKENNIDLIISVPRPSNYRMLIRYMLDSQTDVYCQIQISPTLTSDPLPRGYESVQIVATHFPPTVSTEGKLYVQYLTLKNNGKEAEFFLSRGKWRVTLFVVQSRVHLDKLVMIPEEYYKATHLRQRVQVPCSTQPTEHKYCVDYEYLTITKGPHATTVTSMMHFPSQQQSMVFLTVEKSGDYVLFLHYQKRDSTPSDVLLFFQTGFGNEKTARVPTVQCKYSFGCRQIAIDDENKVEYFTLNLNLRNVLTIVPEGSVSVISVSAIRYEFWNMDYLIPQERCIKANGSCILTTYNIPAGAVKVESEKRGEPALTPSIAMDKTVRTTLLAGDGTPVRIEGKIDSNRYNIFVHYYQPLFGSFVGRVIVESGRATALSLQFKHCPNVGGCRTLGRDKITGLSRSLFMYDKFAITISVPPPNHIWIDYILLVPIRQFQPSMEYPQPVWLAPKFLKECSGKNMIIDKSSSKFCKRAMFTLTTHFNGGASSCGCHKQGSLSTHCEIYGGQCQCKNNIVGRRCNQCRGGYKGFPNCRRLPRGA